MKRAQLSNQRPLTLMQSALKKHSARRLMHQLNLSRIASKLSKHRQNGNGLQRAARQKHLVDSIRAMIPRHRRHQVRLPRAQPPQRWSPLRRILFEMKTQQLRHQQQNHLQAPWWLLRKNGPVIPPISQLHQYIQMSCRQENMPRNTLPRHLLLLRAQQKRLLPWSRLQLCGHVTLMRK